MLKDERRIVPGEIERGFEGDVVKDERADDAVHRADAKLVEILRAQTFRHPQQPFDVLSVGWIPRVLRLWSIVVHPTCQSFQC